MIEVNISDVKKTFAATTIFEGVTFTVKSGERVGLVGPNGCGKTTLLKMIMGSETITEGTISFRKGQSVGYLDQIPTVEDDVLVIDILKDAMKPLLQQKEQLDSLTNEMAILKDKELDKTLKRYTSIEAKFALAGGYEIETTIAKVASGLKIDDDMQNMPFSLLSGGEKTRVMLGHILLKNPSILLLDEPSNHLDLEAIEWLETYLQSYQGAVLVVSHDRYFLDNVCKKIVELSSNKAYEYHGNYSYYVIERERRFLLEMNTYIAQEKKINRMEDQIKQYRIWGVARDSEKMFKRAKELEKRLDKITRLDKPIKDPKKLSMSTDVSRTGKRVLKANDISLSFDQLILLKHANLELYFQDSFAILGENGSGKTTLLKHIMNDYSKDIQTYKWGSKIKLGYLPQEVTFDDESLSVIDYFTDTHQVGQHTARKELAKVRFINDDVFKKIHQLSGGEKSRLTLASLTYEQVNLMILDEPTNHLDIQAREVLEELLLEYTGTILFVSHDRYFIKKIASRVGEITHQSFNVYEGDYEYYRRRKEQEKKASITVSHNSKQKKKQNPIQTKSISQQKQIIYDKITTIEQQISELEELMKEYAFDADKLHELFSKKEELEKEYEHIFFQLETLE